MPSFKHQRVGCIASLVFLMQVSQPAMAKNDINQLEWERTKRVNVYDSPWRARYPSIIKTADGSLLVLFTRKTEEQDKDPTALMFERDRVMDLTGDWLFMTDPDERGVKEQWFLKNHDRKTWMKASAGQSWQVFRKGYYGTGWYAKQFSLPVEMRAKKLEILFEGVDEDCSVYLNEEKLFSRVAEPPGVFRNFPFRIGVSDGLRYGEKNLLVVRVHKTASRTGIYGPVRLLQAVGRGNRKADRGDLVLVRSSDQGKTWSGGEVALPRPDRGAAGSGYDDGPEERSDYRGFRGTGLHAENQQGSPAEFRRWRKRLAGGQPGRESSPELVGSVWESDRSG